MHWVLLLSSKFSRTYTHEAKAEDLGEMPWRILKAWQRTCHRRLQDCILLFTSRPIVLTYDVRYYTVIETREDFCSYITVYSPTVTQWLHISIYTWDNLTPTTQQPQLSTSTSHYQHQ